MKTDAVRNWDFGKKNEARSLALSVIKKSVKTALFFPSDTCLDLIQALKNGLITRKTFLIIVERDQTVVKEIRKFLRKLGFKSYCIHDHKAGVHKLDLTAVLKGRKLDFMFFDICGNIKAEVAYWFYNNQSNFGKNMMMPITLAIHPRGSRAKTRGPKKDSGRLSQFFHIVDRVTREMFYDAPVYGKKNNLVSCEDESEYLLRDFRLTCKALFHIFSTRNISIGETLVYRETGESKTNMAMMNIRILGEKEQDKTFENIIEAYDKKVCGAKKLRKVKKVRKKRSKNRQKGDRLVSMSEVAKYKIYDNIPPHILAKITRQAKANKTDVVMTHAGYKAYLKRLQRA